MHLPEAIAHFQYTVKNLNNCYSQITGMDVSRPSAVPSLKACITVFTRSCSDMLLIRKPFGKSHATKCLGTPSFMLPKFCLAWPI